MAARSASTRSASERAVWDRAGGGRCAGPRTQGRGRGRRVARGAARGPQCGGDRCRLLGGDVRRWLLRRCWRRRRLGRGGGAAGRRGDEGGARCRGRGAVPRPSGWRRGVARGSVRGRVGGLGCAGAGAGGSGAAVFGAGFGGLSCDRRSGVGRRRRLRRGGRGRNRDRGGCRRLGCVQEWCRRALALRGALAPFVLRGSIRGGEARHGSGGDWGSPGSASTWATRTADLRPPVTDASSAPHDGHDNRPYGADAPHSTQSSVFVIVMVHLAVETALGPTGPQRPRPADHPPVTRSAVSGPPERPLPA